MAGGIRDVDAFDGAIVDETPVTGSNAAVVVEWGFKAHDVLELLREARSPAHLSPFEDLKTMRGEVWLEPRFRAR